MDPLLSFSEVDAGSVPVRRPRGNTVAKQLAETAWSPDRRGVFATLEKDGAALRVWQLVDGPGPRLVSGGGGGGRFDGGRGSGFAGSPATTRLGEGRSPSGLEEKDVLRLPVLLEDKKSAFRSLFFSSFPNFTFFQLDLSNILSLPSPSPLPPLSHPPFASSESPASPPTRAQVLIALKWSTSPPNHISAS
jgi:hypothetical protein